MNLGEKFFFIHLSELILIVLLLSNFNLWIVLVFGSFIGIFIGVVITLLYLRRFGMINL
jgi:hypothetical protein